MDRVAQLKDEILLLNNSHKIFLENALKQLTGPEKETLYNYLDFLISKGYNINQIAESYNTMVKDTVKEQLYFFKNGNYRYSTYDEVKDLVYQNPEYMEKYMLGLGVSIFLWPQHLQIHRYFLRKIPVDKKGQYLEIGPGHGFFIMSAMKCASYNFYEGVDISPTSVEMTTNILNSNFFGDFRDFEIHLSDIGSYNCEKKYDAIVMGEVLEHVEDPVALLSKINEISNEGAFIFITTVINAPVIDHIYLFDSIESIENVVKKAGLGIREYFLAPTYDKLSVEENLEKRYPMNIALILEK